MAEDRLRELVAVGADQLALARRAAAGDRADDPRADRSRERDAGQAPAAIASTEANTSETKATSPTHSTVA